MSKIEFEPYEGFKQVPLIVITESGKRVIIGESTIEIKDGQISVVTARSFPDHIAAILEGNS